MAIAGALHVQGVVAHGDVRPGLHLPGGLVALAIAGHTFAHCAFHIADRRVLFTGDALVALDPYTAAPDPASSPRPLRPTVRRLCVQRR